LYEAITGQKLDTPVTEAQQEDELNLENYTEKEFTRWFNALMATSKEEKVISE